MHHPYWPERAEQPRQERLVKALEAFMERDKARPDKPCSCMLCVAARAALAADTEPEGNDDANR